MSKINFKSTDQEKRNFEIQRRNRRKNKRRNQEEMSLEVERQTDLSALLNNKINSKERDIMQKELDVKKFEEEWAENIKKYDCEYNITSYCKDDYCEYTHINNPNDLRERYEDDDYFDDYSDDYSDNYYNDFYDEYSPKPS